MRIVSTFSEQSEIRRPSAEGRLISLCSEKVETILMGLFQEGQGNRKQAKLFEEHPGQSRNGSVDLERLGG
jgi:hypothetical protein